MSDQIEFDHGVAREKGVLRLKGLRGHLARTKPLGVARTFTAMLTVENLYGASHDIWDVNVEAEYHETSEEGSAGAATGASGTGRDAPILPKKR